MSEEVKKQSAFLFTLYSGKKVLLREPKIRDTRVAAKVAGKEAGDNQALLNVVIQEEVTKLLILEINGKAVPAKEKEILDNLFTPKEYSQVLLAVQKIGGGDEVGEPQMTISTSGS